MTSNELNEILNKTRRTKDIILSVEQVEEIIKDLKVLEIIQERSIKYNNCVSIFSLFYEPEVMEWCK